MRMNKDGIMPIYEYRCAVCDHEFEYLVFGGSEPETCPSCGDKRVSRLLSACSHITKGAGGHTVSRSAGASGCGGCASTNCGSCGH